MRCYGGSRLRRHGNITTWSKLMFCWHSASLCVAAAEIRTPAAVCVFCPQLGLDACSRHTTLWLMLPFHAHYTSSHHQGAKASIFPFLAYQTPSTTADPQQPPPRSVILTRISHSAAIA
ncbi:hypothetical protein TRIATDRAFT_255645 [Trichoderma atroviride IMI 206040]|uniref:Secreted protein n=1 Tax=Hypocrea atroviridis (strain ATCC 20476 / IMI 206040) TaxID=452589 RepID=G9NMI4_HYPAI|nr:uncharacterized protein TRIATDRAFT_298319 [Trichoderma atroviride IMI 206040]EHK48114.1 hypothetical protein TRIATDRAFT_255645 [Trichoderma atroviride IMI 206040]